MTKKRLKCLYFPEPDIVWVLKIKENDLNCYIIDHGIMEVTLQLVSCCDPLLCLAESDSCFHRCCERKENFEIMNQGDQKFFIKLPNGACINFGLCLWEYQ